MRNTHTFVTLSVPPIVYLAVRDLLLDAGYDHAIVSVDGDECIDMHGIALKKGDSTDEPTNATTPLA